MICLGVDPGISATGIAVVSRSVSKYEMMASELVKSTPAVPKSERLLGIYEAVFFLLQNHDCDLVAIEKCFHNKNVSSSQSTGAVIGVATVAAAMMGVPVLEVTPQQVKAASGLSGKADKTSVVKMMSRLLNQKRLNHHVADAAACAIFGLLEGRKVKNAENALQRIPFLSEGEYTGGV